MLRFEIMKTDRMFHAGKSHLDTKQTEDSLLGVFNELTIYIYIYRERERERRYTYIYIYIYIFTEDSLLGVFNNLTRYVYSYVYLPYVFFSQ